MSKPNFLWIHSAEQLAAHAALLDGFFELFAREEMFPDAHERETPEVIRERVASGTGRPHTALLVVSYADEVAAGAILEYYPKSCCCLLTYLFVDKKHRGAGLSKQIVSGPEGLSLGLRHIEERYGTRPRAVFFETNNPLATTHDSMSPKDRLLVFARLGAKWLDFDYVQPALEPGKQPVHNLFLCVFPALTRLVRGLSEETLLAFLEEFYGCLEATPEQTEPYLAGLKKAFSGQRNYRGTLPLKELPKFEKSAFQFRRASACFQFVVDESYYSPLSAKIEELNEPLCPVFHSFETDLLRQRFQRESPFFTKKWLEDGVSVKIHFPQRTDYLSEGRRETFFMSDGQAREVMATAKLHYTYFGQSEVRVWHLVLSPDEQHDAHFNEHDLIKLTKHYGTLQEWPDEQAQREYLQGFGFEVAVVAGGPAKPVGEWIAASRDAATSEAEKKYWAAMADKLPLEQLWACLTGVAYPIQGEGLVYHDDFGVRSGMIQLDAAFSEHDAGPDPAFQDALDSAFARFAEKETPSFGEQAGHPPSKIGQLFHVAIGISQSIFDYWRLDLREIIDGLQPRQPSSSQMFLFSRSNLLCLGNNDGLMGTGWGALGGNPYPMIVCAVLAHNDFLIFDANEQYEDFWVRYQQLTQLRALGEKLPELCASRAERRSSKQQLDQAANRLMAQKWNRGERKRFFQKIKLLPTPQHAKGLETYLRGLGQFMSDQAPIKASEQPIEKLLRANFPARRFGQLQARLEDIASEEWLPNVFHYPTERELLEFGLEHRDINQQAVELRQHIQLLGQEQGSIRHDEEDRNASRLELVLSVLSIMELWSFFHEVFESAYFPEVLEPISLSWARHWDMALSLGLMLLALYVVLQRHRRASGE